MPSEKHPNPRLVVVGEAPGWYEAQYGRPFIGPSGKLLDQVLSHYGYKRSEVMYTNVTLCRPEGNATPPKAAVAACRKRLLHEIVDSGARDIVGLGGTASEALVDDYRKITALRVGPPKPATRELTQLAGDGDGHTFRVVPTWHPAYTLRNSDAFPTMVSDIGKLRDATVAQWRPPDWKYFEEPQIALAAIQELMAWQERNQEYRLVVDIECGIDKDNSFDHPNEYDMLCIGLAYAKGKVIVIGYDACHDKDVIELLKVLLKRSKIIAQNGKFDLAGLYPLMGPLEVWFDTMLANYVLDERPGQHSLEVLGIEKLGTPNWKQEITKFVPKGGNYANVPRAILYKYNAYDDAVTWDLYEMFEERLEEELHLEEVYNGVPVKVRALKARDLHDFMVRAGNQLMYLELNGITIDKEYQRQLAIQFIDMLEGIENDLSDIVESALEEMDPDIYKRGVFNPRSPRQVKHFLAAQEITVENTQAEVLEKLLEILIVQKEAGEDHPVVRFLRTMLNHRKQQKLYSTYVEGIRKRRYRGRVYTTYLLHGSTSGRLASRNPNLQNIVRNKPIRKQFVVSKPENVFVQCDYKQAEGRVIATLAQDEYLRDVFCNPDIDIFDNLSDQLYGVGKWEKSVERVRTKAFFYGLSYGREAYSIAMEFGMSVRQAEARLREFMSLIPATAAWQAATRDDVLAGKDLITAFGRRRRFWLITDQNKKDVLNEALSFMPQSTASDICLDAFTHLRPRLRGLAFIRLTIHDSLTAECHEDHKEEVANILMEEMVNAGRRFTDYIPFPVDLSIGKNWGEL